MKWVANEVTFVLTTEFKKECDFTLYQMSVGRF